MRTATKRITTFFAAFLIAFTICLPAGAAGSRVDGYEGGSLYDYFQLGQSQDPDNLTVGPGDEIRIPLTADMFTFSDGKVPIYMEAMTYGQLSRVKVRTKTVNGAETLDYVQFDKDSFPGRPFIRPGGTTFTGTTVYISVKFAKEFISVKDKDFSFLVYLSIDGRRYDELCIELNGTMQVETEYLEKGTTYINLSDGLVAEAGESIQGIRADLGCGVCVHANMFQGQKYCGRAKIMDSIDAYLADRELEALQLEGIHLPDLYPEIVMIFKLQSIGLRRASTRVEIDRDQKFDAGRIYHVYDEDLRYLGVIGDTFPYSGYYFVTGKRIPSFDALPVNL